MPNKRRPRPSFHNANHSELLSDPVNLRILTEIQADPRISMSELGRRVALSAPAVTERVQRLERSGVIAGYRAELDPAALGYGVAAFVRVRPGPGQLQRIAELAAETPEVVECYRVTGDDCFVLKLHVRAVAELDTVLDRFLLHGQTNTSIVQSTVVPPRALPLPGG
jgi:Lrp/AsnC family transcriptional regulator, leucine-responsive regulatory protein